MKRSDFRIFCVALVCGLLFIWFSSIIATAVLYWLGHQPNGLVRSIGVWGWIGPTTAAIVLWLRNKESSIYKS
jgi:hypothetical protein